MNSNPIQSVDDIYSDDMIIEYCQKTFYLRYRKVYQKNNWTLSYVDTSSNIQPDFIRSDGTMIYLQLHHQYQYLKEVTEKTIRANNKILKLESALLITIRLNNSFNIKNMRKISFDIFHKSCRQINERFIYQSKPKIFDQKQWISASKTRNYALNDTLVDWLNLCYERNQPVSNTTDKTSINFKKYIMNQGNEFEKRVIEMIQTKVKPDQFVTICSDMSNYYQNIIKYYEQTKQEIKKGTPIIYQAVLMNWDDSLAQSYGMPDLLVRSDYLDKLVSISPIDKELKKFKAPKLSGKYHYVIVDIKFSTLTLCTDQRMIRNYGSINAYKCQLYIYNRALGTIQGYEPPIAYILGRRYKYQTAGQNYLDNECFSRLGYIDYQGWDKKYIAKTIAALEWIKELREKGQDWKLYPKPSIPELYPNLSSVSDSNWNNFKINYAKEIGDITLLWNCGSKNRQIAHQNGIYTYWDDDCTAKRIGVFGPRRAPIVNQIIKINRKRKFDSPNDRIHITINPYVDNQWMEKSTLRITVDFETINSVFDDFSELPIANDTNYLFMIGVSYQLDDEEIQYKMFLTSELSENAEFQIIYQFYQFLREITDQYLGEEESIPSLYHWGHIERTFFSNLCTKLEKVIGSDITDDIKTFRSKIQWYDLSEVFKRNPIVINGCFKFGLKEVANRLSELNLINIKWDNNSVNSGENAMVLAHHAYQEAKQNNVSIIQIPIIKEIMNYNKVDCTIIHQIVDLIQKINTDNLNEQSSKKRKLE